jgi:serine/threonine-protein kinase RsbW
VTGPVDDPAGDTPEDTMERSKNDSDDAGAVLLSIPAKLEFLDLVDNVVAAVNELMEFKEEDATAVSISVIEAGTNAIQHGCPNDDGHRVRLRFVVDPGELVIEVEDPGKGFDPDRLPDPTSPDNILKERGRGIFIMRQMMDELDFDFSKGTRIRMLKRKR